MKMTIESTTKIVKVDGIDCRVWEGETERGVKVICIIPGVAVADEQDVPQFEAEWQEHLVPHLLTEFLGLMGSRMRL